MAVRNILVPVDFSPRSSAALIWAIELARATDADIAVLHVVPAPASVRVFVDAHLGRPLPHASSATRMDANDRIDELIASVDHTGLTVHQLVEEGDPAATIVQVATDGSHDLMVVGTHGRTGLADLALGSVAKQLISCAPCPVVILRAKD